jgi:TolA-binding protein
MRFTRHITCAALFGGMLLTPISAPAAASKEMQELQRDVAQLEEEVKTLQSALDSKLAALQTYMQQQSERTNSDVTALNRSVTQSVETGLRGFRDQLAPVQALGAKVDNVSNDVSDIRGSLTSLVVTINKQQQQLNDISNQLKLMQAPVAAPPGGDAAGAPPGASAPPPSGQSLFSNAVRDQNGGNPDLALTEYGEFLRLYPDEANASRALSNIGQIHYSQGKLDQAVKDFDAVIEQYPEDQAVTPGAYYMKGMALKKAFKTKEAIASFRSVVAKFPRSDEAAQAKQQLTSMAAGPAPPASTKKGKR